MKHSNKENKNILLPTNFSESSLNAITYCLQMFPIKQTEYLILNSLFSSSSLVELEDIARQESKIKLAKLKDLLQKKFSILNIETKTSKLLKDTLKNIKLEIKHASFDLIVLGIDHRSPKKDLLNKNGITSLVSFTKCPILIVPVNIKYKKPKKIVIAVDSKENLIPMRFIMDLSNKNDSEFLFIYINDSDDNKNSVFLTNQTNIEQGSNKKEYPIFETDKANACEAVLQFCGNKKADLLVIIVENRTTISNHHIDECLTQEFFNKIELPLLILPQE